MVKIAIIGAGSLGFTRRLVHDVLCVPELQDAAFVLHDINEHNLDMIHQLLDRDIKAAGIAATVSKTLDRRAAVADANYVICCVRVAGMEGFKTDIEIPLKYGVDQCVGDTLCAGGIMYGQRTIACMLDFCEDIREVADPDVLMLNYSNPNAMNTWACNAFGGVETVGLCHGVQGGHNLIAKALGVPKEEVDFICAGINHQTWYIQIKHNGRLIESDELLEAMESNPGIAKREKVRIDMLRRFGYFTTESNGHVSEYVPWYRKRPDEIPEWICMDQWILGETGGYYRVCFEKRNWFEYEFPELLAKGPQPIGGSRSHEHGSYIIESLETGRVYRGHFNVPNAGIITNLPDGCIVEVPGYVDRNGINIPVVGELPLACAATCSASVRVQEMAVEAAVFGDEMLLKQAMLHDPLTGAVLNPPEIWQMTDEMLVAQAEWLPQYADYVPIAKQNLERDYIEPRAAKPNPATRLAARSVEEMVELHRQDAERRKEAAAKEDYDPDKELRKKQRPQERSL